MLRSFLHACFFLVLIWWLPAPAFAQIETDERIWISVNVQERSNTSSPWRWAVDTYLRTRDGVGDLDATSGRLMVGYDVTSRSSVWVGYNAGGVFPAAGGFTVEQRLSQQYLWARTAGGGSLSLRTRLEQRFIEGNSATVWRLREQARFTRALGSSRLSLVFSDELFLHLNETSRFDRGLDQNRAFAGLSRPLGGVRIEIGYLNQFSHSRSGPNRMNHVLSTTASMSF